MWLYANAVLMMYVRDQVRALTEMRRVLRPTGLAAVIATTTSAPL